MTDPKCSNCGYEVPEVNGKGLCQTCWEAYDMGYRQAKSEQY